MAEIVTGGDDEIWLQLRERLHEPDLLALPWCQMRISKMQHANRRSTRRENR